MKSETADLPHCLVRDQATGALWRTSGKRPRWVATVQRVRMQ
jgi:hypothetical protein